MKKLLKNLFFVSAIGSVAILASCGGDDENPLPNPPSIEVEVSGLEDAEDPYEAVPGETATFTVTMNVPGTFNVLRVTGTVDGTEVVSEEFPRGNAAVTANADNTEATVAIEFEFDEEDIDTEFDFEFEVVDDSDQTATTTVSVTVVAPPSPEARAYSAILLAAPTGDRTSQTFFSTNTGQTYTANGVITGAAGTSANIDFGYYYGATNMASLAAPASFPSTVYDLGATGQNWGTLNATTFKTTTLDASAFSEVTTWADIDEVYEEGTDEAGVKTGLTAGKVLAFQTASTKTGGAKKGLLLVKSITGTSGSDGKIELDILVQEDAE